MAPSFLLPTMFLVACGKQESKPAAAPAAATTTTASAALGPGEGWLPVRGGRVWYRVSGTGKGTPMVLVHGGPGAGSYYLKPFEDIGDDRKPRCAGPKTVEAHAKLIPGAKFVRYKDAGHVTSWDARDANVRDVREFLRSVDRQ